MSACLGGALNQMVSLGLADGVLTAKPVITYWRHVIKRYTNFALESHDLDFNQGTAQFGANPSCNLDRIGDLVYWMYVRIDLPGIGLSYTDPQTQLEAIVPPSLKVVFLGGRKEEEEEEEEGRQH